LVDLSWQLALNRYLPLSGGIQPQSLLDFDGEFGLRNVSRMGLEKSLDWLARRGVSVHRDLSILDLARESGQVLKSLEVRSESSKTSELFAKTLEFIKTLGKENKTILFVGGKSEARKAVANAGLALAMPYVDGRWIGGALTNFKEIRKRIEKYERLTGERERGELTKYTKKERLLIDREIDNLEIMFGGIVSMKDLPKAMFVVDAKREHIAVKEAQDMGIPVISLVGSDCDIREVQYPIVGNDSSKTSIEFFLSTVVKAYEEGKKTV
jgi:small subunit ribosomal protein S2